MYDSRQHELALPAGRLDRRGRRRLDSDDVARALGVAASEGPAAAARVAALTDAADAYEADLALVGLSDEDVAAGLTAGSYRRRLGRSVVEAAATAPLAALGAVIHAVPYGIMKPIGSRPDNEGMRATVKLLGCTVLFTAVYTTAGVVVGRRRGPVAGVAAFLARPGERVRDRPLGGASAPVGRRGPGAGGDGRPAGAGRRSGAAACRPRSRPTTALVSVPAPAGR